MAAPSHTPRFMDTAETAGRDMSAGYIGSDRPYLDGEHEMQLRCVGLFPYLGPNGPENCFHFTDPQDRLVVFLSRRNI